MAGGTNKEQTSFQWFCHYSSVLRRGCHRIVCVQGGPLPPLCPWSATALDHLPPHVDSCPQKQGFSQADLRCAWWSLPRPLSRPWCLSVWPVCSRSMSLSYFPILAQLRDLTDILDFVTFLPEPTALPGLSLPSSTLIFLSYVTSQLTLPIPQLCLCPHSDSGALASLVWLLAQLNHGTT